MFGFLYSPERSCSREVKSLYQSLFCGLSCQLRKDYGVLARFLVNRDSTFLTLIGDAIAEEGSCKEMKTCCNPLATPRGIATGSMSLEYTSAVSMCALAAKLEDNISDDQGLKKYMAYGGLRMISHAKDKAISTLNSLSFPTQKVVHAMSSQANVESSKPSFEAAAEPTAFAFGTIMGHQAVIQQKPELQPALQDLGRSLGRLIYWRDAIDDHEKDKKSNAFNPLHYLSPTSLAEIATQELEQLKSLCSNINWIRHGHMIESIANHSVEHHQDMTSPPFTGGTGKKKKKSKDRWCNDYCDCCDCNYKCCDSDCCDCCGGCDCGN